MKTIHIFLIFVGLALLQLFIPFQMIKGKEAVLTTGVKYKFKTRPVDPSDPFRGKYITLNYSEQSAKTVDSTWSRGDDIYVKLQKDSVGFARVDKVSRTAFITTDDYVKTKVTWYNSSKHKVNFCFEFNQYYMEESKAYAAEVAYVESIRDSLPENDTYAVVYVKDGKAVLDDVIINEVSIKDYVGKE